LTKGAAKAVATSNVTLSAPQTIDGVALSPVTGCWPHGQSTDRRTASVERERRSVDPHADFVSGTTQPGTHRPRGRGGTANGGTLWQMSNTTAVVVDTGSPTFAAIGLTTGVKSASPTAGIGYSTGAGGAVTQITDATTGVTLSKVCGQITTVALTTAAGAEERFTVTNTTVVATDCVATNTTYAGAGTPIVKAEKIAANAFDIVITNLHASAALNAAMVINFA
jgi:hypothetical protein